MAEQKTSPANENARPGAGSCCGGGAQHGRGDDRNHPGGQYHQQNARQGATAGSCCAGAAQQGHRRYEHHHGDHYQHDHPAAGTDAQHRSKDPVCGMFVDPHSANHRAEHNGQPYYFCSAGCREKFVADPARYLDPAVAAARAEPVPEGTIYTCPMHPEVRQVGPGSCPICGMALEPVLVSLEAQPNHELIDFTRRFWIGLALTVPVVILEMGAHLLGLDHVIPQQGSNWAQMLLASPVVLWSGWPFFLRGWQSLVTRNLNMFTLIAMERASPGSTASWRRSRRGSFPPPSAATTARSRSTSRRRPSSPCSSCSGRCSNCVPARARAAPSVRSSTSPQRRRAASSRTGPRRRSISTSSMSATACACVRARRCLSTARSSKGAAPSTS